jgi:hypothetical protein
VLSKPDFRSKTNTIMDAIRSRTIANPKKLRSSVTNGRKAFVESEADGRGAWTRRWRDLTRLHLDDLGLDDPSAAQVALAKRAATIECELERLEGVISAGGAADFDVFSRLTGTLRRTLEALSSNISRKARDVTSLGSIAEEIKAARSSAADAAADEAAE